MTVLKTVIMVAILLVLGATLYGTLLMRRGFSTQEEPSLLEEMIVGAVRHMPIPKSAREQENPWKDLDNADTQREARERFADHCAFCHANNGSGQTQMGQNLYPKPPDLRLPATQNLTDGELYYIIDKGVRLSAMPGWGTPDVVQDDDTWKAVLFIRHLPKLTAEEEKDMRKYNPRGIMKTEEDDDQ